MRKRDAHMDPHTVLQFERRVNEAPPHPLHQPQPLVRSTLRSSNSVAQHTLPRATLQPYSPYPPWCVPSLSCLPTRHRRCGRQRTLGNHQRLQFSLLRRTLHNPRLDRVGRHQPKHELTDSLRPVLRLDIHLRILAHATPVSIRHAQTQTTHPILIIENDHILSLQRDPQPS